MLTIVLVAALSTALQGDRLPAPAPDTGANLPARPIGINDLLTVTVYGAPELSRTARVGTDGLIRLPMLREKVEVRDLMPGEVEEKIAEAIASADILV